MVAGYFYMHIKDDSRITGKFQQLLFYCYYHVIASFNTGDAMSDTALPGTLPSWIKEHLELYLEDGEAGHLWDASLGGGEGMLSTLLLTTTGRKSGRASILPLLYQATEDGGYCVVASKGGAPTHPAWFLNLEAEPQARIQVINEKMSVKARVATGEERQKLWKMMVEFYAPYEDYQALTEREIPVVVLNPV